LKSITYTLFLALLTSSCQRKRNRSYYSIQVDVCFTKSIAHTWPYPWARSHGTREIAIETIDYPHTHSADTSALTTTSNMGSWAVSSNQHNVIHWHCTLGSAVMGQLCLQETVEQISELEWNGRQQKQTKSKLQRDQNLKQTKDNSKHK
jgi:hypothetical protein